MTPDYVAEAAATELPGALNWTDSSSSSDDELGNWTTTTLWPGGSSGIHTSGNPPVVLECGLEVPDGLTEFVVYGCLLNFVSLLGLLGNGISIIILSRPSMVKSSINYLLIGLATCDTVLILLSVLVYGLPGIYSYTGYLFHYKFLVYPKIVRYLYPLSTTAQMATVYLTLTVTMERYVAVCHPLKARSLCTYGRARTALFVIALFSILYNLPKLWEVQLAEEVHWRQNVTIFCIVPTELRENKLYIAIYVHWSYFFVYYAFPFVALVIFNVAIYKRVRKANRDLRRLSHHQRREIGLATMLLCVVIVFLVCNILPLASNVYENVYVNPPTWLIQIGNLLVTINSGVNFVIYVIFGRRFKHLFLKIFCRVCRNPETGLDCMGRPSRAESPDFQTNEDSIATNMSNIELRNSTRRLHGGSGHRLHHHGSSVYHHHHHQNDHHHHSLRPNNNSCRNGSTKSSVYYPPQSPARNGANGSGGQRKPTAELEDTAFC